MAEKTNNACKVCGEFLQEPRICRCGNDHFGFIDRFEGELAAALLRIEHAKLEVKEANNNIAYFKKLIAELKFDYRMLNPEPHKSRT